MRKKGRRREKNRDTERKKVEREREEGERKGKISDHWERNGFEQKHQLR